MVQLLVVAEKTTNDAIVETSSGTSRNLADCVANTANTTYISLSQKQLLAPPLFCALVENSGGD